MISQNKHVQGWLQGGGMGKCHLTEEDEDKGKERREEEKEHTWVLLLDPLVLIHRL